MRWIYYDPTIISRPAAKAVQHFLTEKNIGLVLSRQFGSHKHFICFITNGFIEISSQPFAPYSVFPLYLYPDAGEFPDDEVRTPNLNVAIIGEISKQIGLRFTNETETGAETFAPIDVLDYTYAVLHSPEYRKRYKEFLKIDFPRVPYPECAKKFWKLVKLGERLRHLHLVEGVKPQPNVARFPSAGANVVEKFQYSGGKVFINNTQFFDNVPPNVWNFYIGGYQPAQKWLKDRKGRTLNFDDIEHYQKIIHILNETIDVMNEIDKT
jgi:predicted helicase